MVGAAVERDVERQAKALLAGGLGEVFEILHASKFGVHVVVAAVLVTYGVRATWFKRFALLVHLGVQGVVRALAVRDTDRVNGHQVNGIEAEAGNVVELLFAILPGGALGGVSALALRPHFVPCTDSGVRGVHAEFHHGAFGRFVLGFHGPGANLVFVVADVVDREGTFPLVVIHEVHGSLFPFFLGIVAVENRRVIFFVAVAENVRGKRDGVARFALEHKTPTFDLGANVFDDEIVFAGRNSCHNGPNVEFNVRDANLNLEVRA